ncbi:MAG: F0F1 ATP synthase subunit B [Archangiaceae bacterium]|nr:F0F1 ATP synthase subunit B [Archangiaceae bacterium]
MHTIVFAAGSITDVQPGLIFWTLITFIIVAFVLRRMAWGPLLQSVNEREKQIQSSIDAAKRERAEAEKLLAEQKTAIAQARSEAAEALRKTQSDMEKLREDLMARSRKEAEELKAEARKSIEAEKLKAVSELKNEAGTLAIQIAEKLLGEKLDEGKHRAMVDQFVADLTKTPAQPRA